MKLFDWEAEVEEEPAHVAAARQKKFRFLTLALLVALVVVESLSYVWSDLVLTCP